MKSVKQSFLTLMLFFLAACVRATSFPTPMPTETPTVASTSTPQAKTPTPTATEAPTAISTATSQATKLVIPRLTPTPTKTPLPIPPVQLILDSEQAIAYSYELLINKGLEPGLHYQGASSALVRFPSGDQGVFVAIGFVGIARGYQFLYRIHERQVELVELLPGGYVWGMRSLHDSDLNSVDIELLYLFTDADGQAKEVLKVVGAGHAGTGLWEDGHFEILNINDNGIKVVFAGVEAASNCNAGGYDKRYQYQYIDLDNDGSQEIVKEGEECEYQFSDEKGLHKTACKDVQEVYWFNGTEYVRRP